MRVGIVGTGTMGAVHAAAWRSTEARLIGCLSAQQSQSDQLAVRYVIRSYGTFTNLLEDVDIGLIEGGWAYPPGIFRTGFDLSGSDGLIEWSSDQPTPMHVLRAPVAEDAGAVGLPVSGIAEDPYTIEICHAYDAIRTGKPFDVTAEDALQSLRIALAARESINTNQPAIFWNANWNTQL
jgi:predicted dehydrogenase